MPESEHKQLVNYRFPEDCCLHCQKAYRNQYGDCQCRALPSGNTVDIGAICDLYTRSSADMFTVDTHEHSRARVVDFDSVSSRTRQRQKRQTNGCTTCVYSVDGDDGRAVCVMRGGVIEDITKGCNKFKEAEDADREHGDDSGDRNDNGDYATIEVTEEVVDDDTDSDTSIGVGDSGSDSGGEVEIPEHANCINCRFSDIDEDNKPYCSRDGMILENTDGVCDGWWDGVKTCANCTYSAMIEGKAVCMLHHEAIVAGDFCYDWRREKES